MNPSKLASLYIALTASTLNLGAAGSSDVLKHVDSFIGTSLHGHTAPGATTPYGMGQLSPDNRTEGWDACAGYYDADTEILGFSHTHLSGTDIGDYADVLLMPCTGEVGINSGTPKKADDGYRSAFKKENQTATPGFYRVQLDRYQVKVELIPPSSRSSRAGSRRFLHSVPVRENTELTSF